MEVWSHRGYTGAGAIENTLDAFDAALDMGATGIEFDVRLCGSGEVILMHDSILWRTDNKFIPTSITSLKDLRKKCSYYIPTLKEVLDRYGDQCKLILDMKGTTLRKSNLEKKVVELVQGNPNVIVSSISLISLCKVAALDDDIKLALIAEDLLSLSRVTPIVFPLNAIHFSDRLATRSRLRFWKNRGMKVRVWTVNDLDRSIELSHWEADGIFTDTDMIKAGRRSVKTN